MKYLKILLITLGILCSFPAFTAPLKVVVTTTLLKEATKAVGGKNVSIHTFTSANSCPGNFDCKPSDVAAINSSKLILYHGFETYLSSISKNKKPIKIAQNKNMLVPNNYILGINQIKDLLIKLDPENKSYYSSNANKAIVKTKNLDKNIKSKSIKLKGVKVICAEENIDFVKYLGFHVIYAYPQSDKISGKEWSAMTQKAKKEKIKITIDNLQTGQYVTAQLAKDIKAKHIVLSNFPDGLKNTSTYEKCVIANLNICTKVIK